MPQLQKTVIFDLDGTIYQNTVFHIDYVREMVTGTRFAGWEEALVRFAEDAFAGKRLRMNHFYRLQTFSVHTPEELFEAMEKALCDGVTYREGLAAEDLIYLGDAWAVLNFMGKALGCTEGERGYTLYRRVRHCMEEKGMQGNAALRESILALQKRCRVILVSNSYRETVEEFLRQLGFDGVFPVICYSARKPYGMIQSLLEVDEHLLDCPDALISIGDHAFNDLMPIAEIGGHTVWMNPYPDIEKPVYNTTLETLDQLAEYLYKI